MADEHRNLTDDDVDAIVGKLKSQLVSDFYGEVGKGLWGWIKKAIWMLLLLLAIQGMAGDRPWLQQIVAGR